MAKRPKSRRQELEEKLLMAGRKLSTAAVMFHTALAAKQGLSATEEKALEILHRSGPLTAGDLSAHSGLAPPSVTGLINRLERKGFARRVKDTQDGRRVLVEVIPASTDAFAPHFADFVEQMQDLFSHYTVEQLRTILDFLERASERQKAAAERLSAAP